MRYVCAWCQCVIGGRGQQISHGICRRCFRAMWEPQFDFMRLIEPIPGHPPGSSRRLRSQPAPDAEPQPALALGAR